MSSETALNFGPQWIRKLTSDSISTSSVSDCAPQTTKFKPSDYRYGKEEILNLFCPTVQPPFILTRFPEITSQEVQHPILVKPLSDDEQRLLTQGANSQSMLRNMGRGASSTDAQRVVGIRGGKSDAGSARGRGIGRGIREIEKDRSPREAPRIAQQKVSKREDDWRLQRAYGERVQHQTNDDSAFSADGECADGNNGLGDNSHLEWRRGPPRARGGNQTGWSQKTSSWGSNRGGFNHKIQDEALPEWSTGDNDIYQPSRDPNRQQLQPKQPSGNNNTEFQHDDAYAEDWESELLDVPEAWDDKHNIKATSQEVVNAKNNNDALCDVDSVTPQLLIQQPQLVSNSKNFAKENLVITTSANKLIEETTVEIKKPTLQTIHSSRLWTYKDPQNNIQGPFSSKEMDSWCKAGFFALTLPLKRDCDSVYSSLGTFLDSYGDRVPFHRGGGASSPPPIHIDRSQLQLDSQSAAMMHLFPNIPQEQQDHLLTQMHLMQQQLQQTSLSPSAAAAAAAAANMVANPAMAFAAFLQLQSMGLAPSPGVGKVGHMEPVNIVPSVDTAGEVMKNVWQQRASDQERELQLAALRLQREREEELRIREEELRKQAEEVARQKEQMQEFAAARLKAEQESAELRRHQEESLRKLTLMQQEAEEQRRFAAEERRLREQEETERRRLEDVAAQLRRQQEEESAARLRRQKEKDLEALEKMRQAEVDRQLRVQEKHLNEQNKNDWTLSSSRKEKVSPSPPDAPIEAVSTPPTIVPSSPALDRQSKTQNSTSKRIALPSLPRPAPAPVVLVPAESLVEIQRVQAEVEAKEAAAAVQAEHELQKVLATSSTPTWSGWGKATTTNSISHKSKSINEIMAEEESKELQRRREYNAKQSLDPPLSGATTADSTAEFAVPMWGNNWASKVQKNMPPPTPAAAVVAAPVRPALSTSIWSLDSFPAKTSSVATASSAPKNVNQFPKLQAGSPAASSDHKQPPKTKQNSKTPPALAVAVGVTSSSSKDEAAVVRALAAGRAEAMQDELTSWCQKQLEGLSGADQVDIPTLVELLRELDSPFEVEDYITQYLGESPRTAQFAKLFLQKRRAFREDAVKKHQQTRLTLSSSQQQHGQLQSTCTTNSSTTTTMLSTSTNKASHNTVVATSKAGNSNNKKKKTKKMMKVNDNLLGFSCGADPNRVNMGQIERVD